MNFSFGHHSPLLTPGRPDGGDLGARYIARYILYPRESHLEQGKAEKE
jgi:hypothetical protein